jgi:hypothetical protein
MKLKLLSMVLFAEAAAAGQPLAVFETHEHLGRDWPRTLVTYQREFPAGTAQPGEVRLMDATGQEQACQLWRVKEHADGSMASARISFLTGLAKGSRYRFELQAGKPGGVVRPLRATTDAALTTLDNGIVALRLPRAGEMKFDPPLAMGQDQAPMVAAYGQQAAKGIAPGPIQGVRLADGRWVGGSYFFAAKPDEAPRVTGYTCRITEQGPLFVEAVIRYTFTGGGWYECTARVLAGDQAVRIDEQFDMGTPGSMWDFRMMVSLASGWREGGWKPDAAYWISSEERLKGRDAQFQAALRGIGLKVPSDCGSTPIRYDEPFKHVFDVAVRYPWHPNAQFFGLVNTANLSSNAWAAGNIPFLAVVPMCPRRCKSGPKRAVLNWIRSCEPDGDMKRADGSLRRPRRV